MFTIPNDHYGEFEIDDDRKEQIHSHTTIKKDLESLARMCDQCIPLNKNYPGLKELKNKIEISLIHLKKRNSKYYNELSQDYEFLKKQYSL
jgi:hypothetical protein